MNDRFLRACQRLPVDATPVWFMRQAGRYIPEYRALRERYSMLELCRTPELAAQVTAQPLRLGVDAAIVFADILLPLEPMGAPFEFAKDQGPVIPNPIRDLSDIRRLTVPDPEQSLGFVLQTIRLLRRELSVPLIGFAGAPFTLASYLIEGGRSSQFTATKRLMYCEPEGFNSLMSKLAETVRRFLHAQILAGAQAVQVFDSWVGQLGPEDYSRYVAPHMTPLLSDLESTGVPVIHFGTATSSLLELMSSAGGSVMGLDARVRLSEAWPRVGHHKAVQGNLDPAILLGPRELMQTRAREILEQAAPRWGHIFNLGHGILPETDPDQVQALVDFVHVTSATLHTHAGSP
jgi:uroporphyrinogen decarboxylase